MKQRGIWVGTGLISLIVTCCFYIPSSTNSDFFFGLILLLITILGIIATFSIELTKFKVLTFGIFIAASITNIFWFFILEYSYQLYIFHFTITNLCFIFVYALFFYLLPYYAIKYQERYEQSSIRGYHIHEGAYGILLILLGFIGFLIGIWRTQIIILDFFKYHIFLFLGTAMIILGAFLFGRDFNDVRQLKFIESMNKRVLDPNFNDRVKYHQIGKYGIVFTLLGINFFFQNKLWGILFIDRALFIIFGMVLIILGAIFGGLNPTYFAKKTKIL